MTLTASPVEKFLRLFYIVLPSRTTFDRLEDVPDYIGEAIPYFVLTMGLEVGIYYFNGSLTKASKKQFRLNDAITSINQGSIQQLSRLFIKGIELSSYIFVWNNFRIYALDSRSLTTWILTFLACDCGYYFFHRMAHEINLFWAAHVVHHSSEYYNQTTATRQSIFQQFFSWPFYLPAALFIPPTMFSVHKQLVTLYQYWIHTEIVPKLGWLEYIINTPSAHRVHHGRNPYCIDKNYAGTLIIWDRIFGTYEEESEEIAYGITHPINTFDSVEIQTHQFKSIWHRVWETKGLLNKFKVVFYGPGWIPGTGRLGNPSDIPLIDSKNLPKKYDPELQTDLAVYSVIHTLMSVGMLDAALLGSFDSGISKAIATWTALGIVSLGHVLNGKKWSEKLEIARNLVGFFMVRYGIRESKIKLPLQIVYGSGVVYMAYRMLSRKQKIE